MRCRLPLAARIIGTILPLFAVPFAEAEEISIPMRDGQTLAGEVHRPKEPGRYPAVLIQTPYNKRLLGGPIGGDRRAGGETGRGAVSDLLALLDREQYAYVVVDWRGFFASKGAMAGVDRNRWKRGQDGYDCVEWIASQDWSNGRVGTWGGSALGKQQFDTAAEKPPHLVCCVPLIAAMGTRYADFYEGGVLLEAHVERLDQLGFEVSRLVKSAPDGAAPIWGLVERRTNHPERIEVPCLLVSGWWDNYPGQVIACFEALRRQGGPGAREGSKLLMGPWDHVGVGLPEQGDMTFKGAALASAHAAKAFLDFHLLEKKDNGWEKTPPVRWWVVGEEGWQEAAEWTALPRKTQSFTLTASRQSLLYDPKRPSPTLGGANLPPLAHGPRRQESLESRADVVLFRLGPLDEPLRLEGEAAFRLRLRADRPDFHLTARLCRRDPEGRTVLLADAAARFQRKGEGSLDCTLRFPPTAVLFPPGHELVLYVSPANWPRYARSTHTGTNAWEEKAALPLQLTLTEEAELLLPCLVPVPEKK